ncbi:hypothetical protein D3C86_1765300 [compost metagenome]
MLYVPSALYGEIKGNRCAAAVIGLSEELPFAGEFCPLAPRMRVVDKESRSVTLVFKFTLKE